MQIIHNLFKKANNYDPHIEIYLKSYIMGLYLKKYYLNDLFKMLYYRVVYKRLF